MKCVVCVLVCVISVVSGANILAVGPTIGKSHYVVFDSLINGLAQRGHNITYITVFPQDRPVDNVHEISVKSILDDFVKYIPFSNLKRVPTKPFDMFPMLLNDLDKRVDVLNHVLVSQLLLSDANFDLFVYEVFLDDVFLGIAHKYSVPVIGISSCDMFPWVADWFGVPANPAYVPTISSGYTSNMDLYQRAYNTLIKEVMKIFYWGFLEHKMTEGVRKKFGLDTPPVSQLVKNVSLYFTNTHFTLFGAQPYPPQVVDVSGLHVKQAKPLPQVLFNV